MFENAARDFTRVHNRLAFLQEHFQQQVEAAQQAERAGNVEGARVALESARVLRGAIARQTGGSTIERRSVDIRALDADVAAARASVRETRDFRTPKRLSKKKRRKWARKATKGFDKIGPRDWW
jgi:hypothetical protein